MNPANTQNEAPIGRRMAKGAAWLVLLRLARRIIGVANMVIMARLLVPADFGLVVLATSIFGILDVLGSMSLNLALIRMSNPTRQHYDTVWTMSLLRGAIVALMLFALAGTLADFYAEPRLAEVLLTLGLATLFDGLRNVGAVNFEKELAFSKTFQITMYSRLISFSVTVVLAIVLRSYWALIIGLVVDEAAQTLMSYLYHPYRPRLSLSKWREFIHFSKWLVISNIGQFLTTKLDNFMLAKFVSATTLGHYVVAFEISNLPTTNLIGPMQSAIFPGFAKIAHDRQQLVANYLDAMALVLMVAVPVGVGIWLTADSLVYVMLGIKWLEAIPLLQILSLYGVARLAYANTRAIYLALGRPNLVAYTTCGQVVVLAPILFYGVSTAGAIDAAWALVVSTLLTGLGNLYIVARMLDISWLRTLAAIWRTLVAAAGMIVAGLALRPLLPDVDGMAASLLTLAGMILGCGLAYVAGQGGLWLLCGRPAGAEAHVLNLLGDQVRKLRRRRGSATH